MNVVKFVSLVLYVLEAMFWPEHAQRHSKYFDFSYCLGEESICRLYNEFKLYVRFSHTTPIESCAKKITHVSFALGNNGLFEIRTLASRL